LKHELVTVESGHSYESGAVLIAHGARKFGLEVSPETEVGWRSTLRAVHDLDAILDSDLPLDKREAQYDEVVQDIVRPDSAIDPEACGCSVCNLKATVQWSSDKQQDFLVVANGAKEIALQKRQQDNAWRLGRLAIEEGKLCARLFALHDSPNSKHRAFQSWVGDLIGGGTALDTAVDLPEDYRYGLTRVLPTIPHRALIFSMGAPYAMRAFAQDPSVIRAFKSGVSAVIDDRNKAPSPASQISALD